jgi:ATP synthase I chain
MTTFDLKRIERRLAWIGIGLVLAGSVVTAVRFGLLTGASFLAGGALAAVNLAWLRQIVSGFAFSDPKTSRRRLLAGYIVRLVLIPLGLYAMIRFFSLSIPAAVAGFAVFNCSVFVEGVLEAFGYRPR